MTLADLATTFGPTAGFLIYLYITRKPDSDKGDDAMAELRAIKELLIDLRARIDAKK